MQIFLDLSRHCIETEIRKQHNKALSAYFRMRGRDRALEARIEALENAQRRLDFMDMRHRHEELRGGGDADVRLHVEDDGHLQVILNGTIVVRV
jgi:hypothetical protein